MAGLDEAMITAALLARPFAGCAEPALQTDWRGIFLWTADVAHDPHQTRLEAQPIDLLAVIPLVLLFVVSNGAPTGSRIFHACGADFLGMRASAG